MDDDVLQPLLDAMSESDRDAYLQTGNAYGWVPDPISADDLSYGDDRLGAEAPPIMPTKVDLRTYFPQPFDQGPVLSCTAQAVASAIQFVRERQALPPVFPSRMFIWWNVRKMEGNESLNTGAYMRNAVKSTDKDGYCPEDAFPYDITRFRDPPPADAVALGEKYKSIDYFRIDNSDLLQLKTCLAAGYPFLFGFTVYSSITEAETQNGRVKMPVPTDRRLGGHAVLAVGFDDASEHFIVRNSWGVQKGDGGYYYFPYAYLTDINLAKDFWTIRLVTNKALKLAPV